MKVTLGNREFQEDFKIIIETKEGLRYRVDQSIHDGITIIKQNDNGTDAIVIKPIDSGKVTIE